MKTRIIIRTITVLLVTMVSALADIDSGGGQTSIGSNLNASSIGSPFATGQYVLGNELNRTGLIETLYPGNFLNSGLVAYYPFNGNAEDESGNDNDGTVNGATLTTDRNGNADSAYYFNGGNDISVPDNPALSFGSGDMSVSIWYKFDGGFRPTQLIGQVEADPQGGKWLIITQGQNWLFHSQHGNNWLAPVPIVQNEDWHHLVYVKQANRYISYLDGSYVTHSESQPAIPLPDPTGNLYIGRGEGSPLRGSLDDVRIYNRGLSAEEVSELYDPERPEPELTLEIAALSNGSVSGGGTYQQGTTATLEASPSLGYLFTGWSGDASGTDNPLAIVMDGNQTVGATFAQDARDPDQDGLSNYQELVLHGTDPDNADSDGDGFNDGEELAGGGDPNDATSLPFHLDPETATADPLDDTLSFAVNTPEGTEWTAESLADWLTITGGSSGTGPGTVTYTVSRNSSTEEREGQIRIATEGGPAFFAQLGQDIDGEAAETYSGERVSLSADGNRVAIGAEGNDGNGTNAGHVRIYELSGNSWVQLGQDIDGEAEGDRSGGSVSLSADGNRVAIGAYNNGGTDYHAGQVRIYGLSGNTWIQLGQDIDGEAAHDRSGLSVSLSADGTLVAIGAHWNSGNGEWSGHVRIYGLSGNTWIQLGQDIDGVGGDHSGWSVSLSADGNRVAIGAPANDENGSSAGKLRIYGLSGNTWIQLGQDIDGEAAWDWSGESVSLSADGNRVAIGGVGIDGNSEGNAGQVRIYGLSGNTWIQLGQDIDGEAAGDGSGRSVSLSADGNRVAIGADGNGNGSGSGHVRIYGLSGNTWIQLGQDIDGEATEDYSGWSVSLSADGNRVAIGAHNNDGNGSDSGHVRIYNLDEPQPSQTAFHTVTQPGISTYELTVGNLTNGSVSGGGIYQPGTTATLEASAALGYLFTGWSGDASGTDNPLAIVMDGDQTVGATFGQDARDPDQDGLSNYQELVLHETDPDNADSDGDGFNDGLEIAENSDPNGTGNYPTRVLTVSDANNGTVTGGGTYRLGTDATLEASAALGYVFTAWSGDASGSDNPLALVMDGNQTVGATFGQDTRDPDQDGLSNYQELVLHETDPDNADSDGDGFNDGLEIAENSDPNAAQDYPTRILTVSTPDNGTVTGGGIYGFGSGAVLEASPAPGYVFTAWTGDASGNNNPLALIMYENQSVGAVFAQDQRDPDQDGLSNWAELVLHGTDPDNADSDGDGFNDGLEISEDTNPNAAHSYPSRVLTVSNTSNGTVAGAGPYRLGTDATLEASAALGYLFAGWTGDGSGTDNPLVIVMDGDRSVGATFGQDTRDPDQDGLSTYRELVLHGTDPDNADSDGDGFNDGLEIAENTDPNAAQDYPTRILTVSTPDNGTVTGGGIYGFGSGAVLEASPAPGYVFTAWTGDASGNNNPLALIMYENQSVGAVFAQDQRDPDQDGLSNWAELVLHGTDPDNADSDGDGFNDGLEISENSDPNAVQSYPTRILTISDADNGTVTGGGAYGLGRVATLEAIPDPGYVFTSWTGDGSGTDNPLTIVMDGNQTVGAIFTQESPDPGARLVNVTFNEDLSIASLFLKGLTQGQVYHVTGTVDGEDFFWFSESEFTADTSGLVVLPVNVAFRPYGVLLKVVEGPIPAQDP